MENSQTCAQPAMRDGDEDVSKRQDAYEEEEVGETPQDVGVEDDEDGNVVATDMRNPCSARTESATRKRHQFTRTNA